VTSGTFFKVTMITVMIKGTIIYRVKKGYFLLAIIIIIITTIIMNLKM
jgi:hypothetical protein